jgi:hypothetical protein
VATGDFESAGAQRSSNCGMPHCDCKVFLQQEEAVEAQQLQWTFLSLTGHSPNTLGPPRKLAKSITSTMKRNFMLNSS